VSVGCNQGQKNFDDLQENTGEGKLGGGERWNRGDAGRERLFKSRLQEAAAGGTILRKKSVSSSKQRAVVGAAIRGGCEKSVRRETKREAKRAKVCEGLLRLNKSDIDRQVVFDMGPYEKTAIYMRGSKKHTPELPKVEGTRTNPERKAQWVDVQDSCKIRVTEPGVLICHGKEELALLLPRSVVVGERMLTKRRNLEDVFQALEALEQGASKSTCRDNPCCERVVGVDGAMSKCVNVGTKRAKFGAGLTTTRQL